ncbi:baculoviral IAP repeat-containing protein 2-like isoform X1 [Biomphalaria glabrata]|nr:baculoviral IAP repeat-containing protein 2 isoform X1 [Biomphalaria glabrata]
MGVAAPREYLLVSGRSITRSQDGASNLPAPNVLSSAGVPPPQSLNGDFPLYPMYSRLQKRRESLQSWMFSNILDPNMLAQIGFFYAGYGDCVRCFQCGLGLRSWKLGDDVLVEHTKFRPSCSLLQSILARRNSNSTNEDQSPAQTAAPLNDSNGLDTPKFQMLLAPRSTQNTAVNTEQPSSTQSNAIGQSSLPEDNTQDVIPAAFTSEGNLTNVSSNDHYEGQGLETPTTLSQGNHTSAKQVTVSLLKKENQMLHKLLSCRMCKQAPIKELFLPCGHLCTCTQSKDLQMRAHFSRVTNNKGPVNNKKSVNASHSIERQVPVVKLVSPESGYYTVYVASYTIFKGNYSCRHNTRNS